MLKLRIDRNINLNEKRGKNKILTLHFNLAVEWSRVQSTQVVCFIDLNWKGRNKENSTSLNITP